MENPKFLRCQTRFELQPKAVVCYKGDTPKSLSLLGLARSANLFIYKPLPVAAAPWRKMGLENDSISAMRKELIFMSTLGKAAIEQTAANEHACL